MLSNALIKCISSVIRESVTVKKKRCQISSFLFLPFSSLHPAHHHGDDEVDRIKDVDPETGCRFRSNPPSDEDKDYVPTVRRNPTGTAERGEVRDGSRTPSCISTTDVERLYLAQVNLKYDKFESYTHEAIQGAKYDKLRGKFIELDEMENTEAQERANDELTQEDLVAKTVANRDLNQEEAKRAKMRAALNSADGVSLPRLLPTETSTRRRQSGPRCGRPSTLPTAMLRPRTFSTLWMRSCTSSAFRKCSPMPRLWATRPMRVRRRQRRTTRRRSPRWQQFEREKRKKCQREKIHLTEFLCVHHIRTLVYILLINRILKNTFLSCI